MLLPHCTHVCTPGLLSGLHTIPTYQTALLCCSRHPAFPCLLAKSLQSCLTLCHPMDCSPPGSSVHGILRQEYWDGLPCPPPGDLPTQGLNPCLLHLLHCQRDSVTTAPYGKPLGGDVTVPYVDCDGGYRTVTQHCAVKCEKCAVNYEIYRI